MPLRKLAAKETFMRKFILFGIFFCLFVSQTFAVNYALSFDGYDDFVEILNNNNSLSLTAMTVEAWVKASPGGSVGRVVYKNAARTGNSDNYTLNVGNNSAPYFHIEEAVGDRDYSVTSTVSATSTQWMHIAGVYDGNQMRIYINGMLDNTITIGSQALYQGAENLFLGTDRFSNHGGYPVGQIPRNSYSGLIDEVRIWNIARTDQQIAENYNKTISGTTTGLVGYWNFDEALDSQTVLDLSGNNNHGVLGLSTLSAADDPARVLSDITIVPEASTWVFLLFGLYAFMMQKRYKNHKF